MAAPPIAYVVDISLGQNRAAAITGTQEQNIFHAQQLGSRYDSFVTRLFGLWQRQSALFCHLLTLKVSFFVELWHRLRQHQKLNISEARETVIAILRGLAD